MPTPTQPWLRAELIAAPETSPGAQLMIPADGIEFHDDQLVFHHQGDVVYVAPQGQLRSITWFARQPHPETARRKAQWPNHGTRWTDEERAELQRHLRAGHSWKTISHAHGRSRTGCQQEAVKQGWLEPDTLVPTATLLGAEAPGAAVTEALSTESATDTQACEVTNAAVVDASPVVAPADAPPHAADPTVSADSAPAIDLTPASAGSLPSASASSAAMPLEAVFASATPDASRADPTAAHIPRHGADQPRIPHQRTDSQPDGAPDKGSDPDSGPGSSPGAGSRFLSRAQSSLARATLGAYMSPPRGTT